ncbi:MAG: hypothetical protein ACOX1O_05980 [Eggerthellaceae bacterium]|jgi:hypothetical protein
MSKKKKKVHGMTPKEAAAARKEIDYTPSGKSDFQEWWSRQPTRAKVGSIASFLLLATILVGLFVVPYFMFN